MLEYRIDHHDEQQRAMLALAQGPLEGCDAPPLRRPGWVALSPVMQKLADRVAALAPCDTPLLITGDPGTGKKWVARSVHASSPRWQGPLVHLEGARLAELIAEPEPAPVAAEGEPPHAWFVEATGGTLVLDRPETLPMAAQVHLLRVLDEPRTRARRTVRSEPRGVRVVTVSGPLLIERLLLGEFLEPLYRRLSGARLHVPSLAERRSDLRPLVMELLRELEPSGTPPPVSRLAWDALSSGSFPGNVRGLRSILAHAVEMADGGPIEPGHLPASVLGPG